MAESAKAGQPAAPAPDAATAAQAAAAPAAAPQAISNFDGQAISEKVQIVLVTPYNDTVAKLKARFAADENTRVFEANAQSAPALCRKLLPCLLIGSITDNTDIVRQLTLLRTITAEVKKNRIKALMLSKIKNGSIVKAFEDFGCHEYIIEPIPERSLKFKIDLQTKAVGAQRRQMRRAELAQIEATGKEAEQKGKFSGTDQLTDDEMMELAAKKGGEDEDNFVFRSNKVKKNGSKWTMRMKGPDPKNGDWVQLPQKDAKGEPTWQFVEKGGDPNKPPAKGAPQFTGEKPEFVNGEWQFSGIKPKLAMVGEGGKELESKVSADAEGLNIGKDSKLPAWKVKDSFPEDKVPTGKIPTKQEVEAGLSGKAGAKLKGAPGEAGEATSEIKDKLKPEARKDSGHPDLGMDASELAGLAMKFDEEPEAWGDKTKDGKPAEPPKFGLLSPKPGEKPPAPKWKGEEVTPAELKWIAEEEIKRKSEKKPQLGLADLKRHRKKLAEEEKAKNLAEAMEAPPDKPEKPFGEGGAGAPDIKDKIRRGAEGDEEAAVGAPKGRKKPGFGGGEEEEGAEPSEMPGMPGKGRGAKGGPGEKGSEAEPGGLGAPDVKGKRGFGEPGGETPEGKLRKKDKLTDLSDLAMDLEEMGKSYGQKAGAEGPGGAPLKGAPGGEEGGEGAIKGRKKGGPGEKGGEGEETPESTEALSELVRKKRKAEAAAKKKGREGELGSFASPEEILAKKKKDIELDGRFEDESSKDGRALGTGGEAIKSKLRAHDSDQSGPGGDEEDKLIEIEGISARLKAKGEPEAPPDAAKFEYPIDYFGSADGTWDSTGVGDTDDKNRKLFVFVEPWVRSGSENKDLVAHSPFWVYRSGEKPKLVGKRMWVFKSAPTKVERFDKLTATTQSYLFSLWPGATRTQKLEAARKAQEELEAKVEGSLAARRKPKAEKGAAEDEGAELGEAEGAELGGSPDLDLLKKGQGGDEGAAALEQVIRKKKKGARAEEGLESSIEDLLKKAERPDEEEAAAGEGAPAGKKKRRDGEAGAEAAAGRRPDEGAPGAGDETGAGMPGGRKRRGGEEGEEGGGELELPGRGGRGRGKGGAGGEESLDFRAMKKERARGGETGQSPDVSDLLGTAEGKKRARGEETLDLTRKKDQRAPGAEVDEAGNPLKEAAPLDEEGKPRTEGEAAAAAAEKKKAVQLPSATMMGVVLAEMLMFAKDGVGPALNTYLHFSAGCYGGAEVSLYALDGKIGVLVASTGSERPPGHREDFGMNEPARAAMTNRAAAASPDGKVIYCPVLPIAVYDPAGAAIGLLVIEPTPENSSELQTRLKYLQAVAQVFRGVIIHAARKIAVKEAA